MTMVRMADWEHAGNENRKDLFRKLGETTMCSQSLYHGQDPEGTPEMAFCTVSEELSLPEADAHLADVVGHTCRVCEEGWAYDKMANACIHPSPDYTDQIRTVNGCDRYYVPNGLNGEWKCAMCKEGYWYKFDAETGGACVKHSNPRSQYHGIEGCAREIGYMADASGHVDDVRCFEPHDGWVCAPDRKTCSRIVDNVTDLQGTREKLHGCRVGIHPPEGGWTTDPLDSSKSLPAPLTWFRNSTRCLLCMVGFELSAHGFECRHSDLITVSLDQRKLTRETPGLDVTFP